MDRDIRVPRADGFDWPLSEKAVETFSVKPLRSQRIYAIYRLSCIKEFLILAIIGVRGSRAAAAGM
jgi:hypothetical protein